MDYLVVLYFDGPWERRGRGHVTRSITELSLAFINSSSW